MATGDSRNGKSLQGRENAFRRVGHKGADAVVPGNTLESFEAAVEIGVDMIELDVLRDREGRLVIAHDYGDARRRRPLDLTEALDAFLEPPLDEVEIDCDVKLPGREGELAGALRARDLIDRAMVSTMEISSLQKLQRLEPGLRRGWTYPKTTRDWTKHAWARPALLAGLLAMRRALPRLLPQRAEELGLSALWPYHQVVTPKLIEAARDAGVEVITWTVDDAGRMDELLAMGVDGVCSNDPRLFGRAAAAAAPEPEAEPEAGNTDAEQAAEELAGEAEPEREEEKA